MKITPSQLPLPIQRAYGIPAAPTRSAPMDPEQVRGNATSPALVGGRVSGLVDFEGAPPPTGPADTLQLYRRTADRVEAAIAVELGRTLDVSG